MTNHTCPMPKHFDKNARLPIVGNMYFYQLNKIISGVCCGIVCVLILSLMFWHGIRMSKPKEQIKLMKVSWLLPLYTITSFIAVCAPRAYNYLEPWLDFYQGVALGTFFLLLCQYLASEADSETHVFFTAFQLARKEGQVEEGHIGPFRRQWMFIYQHPVVSFIIAIISDITEAKDVYCLEYNNAWFAHIWLFVIDTVSLALAMTSVIIFYQTLQPYLKNKQPMTKLLAFKLIVGLTFLETIIFTILRSSNVMKETDYLSYSDIHIGIPNLVICLQMVPLAIFFTYAYRVTPYLNGGPYQGGFLGWRGWVGILNPMELVRATGFAFSMISNLHKLADGEHEESMLKKSTASA